MRVAEALHLGASGGRDVSLLEAYQPSHQVEQRLAAYADATRLRLACVYDCRPAELVLAPHLLALVGRPIGSCCDYSLSSTRTSTATTLLSATR